jgi:hypothetical protein
MDVSKDPMAQKHREVLLRRLDAEDYERDLLARVKKLAIQNEVEVKFLIALMPDYVDSNSAWMFDGYLDAVQRAAGSARFVLDRFYLPDWSPERGAESAAGPGRRAHETEPGVVLFRGTLRPAQEAAAEKRGEDHADLLVVLVPTETATSGVHVESFLSAAALAAVWNEAEPLRVLGPCFSGSTPSLVRALNEAENRHLLPKNVEAGDPLVRIIAGSASALANKARLEQDTKLGSRVQFHSTSVSDRDYQRALSRYLGRLNEGWGRGERMAMLVEGNTGWGQGVLNTSDATHTSTASAASAPRPEPLFPRARRLTFPLHISRLRGAATARGRSLTAGEQYSSSVALELEDRVPPGDRIPTITPGITEATVEATLARLLDSLERLDVSAVGIYATDKRDHLFLAQEITRRAPNVLLFALDSSLLYLHPDFRSYLRGTLVASPNPLFNLTQLVAGRPTARRLLQFPSSEAASVYNAALALLGRPERMIDYGAECGQGPQEPQCAPSVWLGVVGQNDIWPLHREALTDENQGYSWRGDPGQAPSKNGESDANRPEAPPPAKVAWPREATALVAGLALLLLAHALLAAGIVAALRGRDTLRRILPMLEPPQALSRRLRLAEASGTAPSPAAGDDREVVLRQEWRLQVAEASGAMPRPATEKAREVVLNHEWRLSLAQAGGTVKPPATEEAPEAQEQQVSRPRVDEADGSVRPPLTDEAREAVLRQEYGLSLLACFGALWAATTWLGGVAWAGQDKLSAGPLPLVAPVIWLGTGFTRDVLLLLLAVGAIVALWPNPTRRQGGVLPLTLFRVLPVAVGLFTLYELRAVFNDPLSLYAGELGPLNALRALSLGSFVSPTPAVLLLAAVAYTWGFWNLRRVHMQAGGFRPDSPVVELLAGGHRPVRQNLLDALNHPALLLCSPCSLALVLFVAVPLGLGWDLSHAVDGPFLARFLRWGTAFAVFLMGHTIAHCARLGTTLLVGLRTLNVHPLGSAFSRVAREPFMWHPSLKVPDGRMLAPLVRQAGAVVMALRFPRPPEPPVELIPAGPDVVDPEVYAKDVCSDDPFQATRTWARLERFADPLARILELGVWNHRPYPLEKPEPPEWQKEAETFLALQVACALRHVLARLLSGLTLALVGLFAILAAHLFYVFQGRAFWLTVDWVNLGLGTALAVFLLVRLEKDAVLSRLWSTEPGRVGWSGAFVKRMVIYGALPVVSLFATFFPEVGQTIFAWIEPVKKVLP